MPKYFSGRVKRTPQGSLTTDRYQYLGLNQAEPNLGDPPELENIPAGQRYQIVSVEDAPGKRFWIPLGGGVTPGSITVRDEGNIVPNVSASSSISDLDFKGSAVNVTGFLKQDGTPGTAVTITVAPPGLDHQVLFNDNGDFGAASRLIYDNNSNKVGIGSTQPEQDLDLLGNFKISGDLYDKDNDPGTTNQVLVKSATGGLEWADQSIDGVASAGGTITQVQYHNALGKVDGASNFVFDYNNNRVGIGSTQPTKLLDILGESKFTGNLEVIGITTFVGDVFVQGVVTTEDVTNIDSLGIVTARKGLRTTDGGLIVVGVTTLQTTRLPDNTSLFLGSNDDLQLVHDGSNSIINDNGDGSLVLQQAGSTKLEVTGTGVTVTGVTSTTDLFVEDKVESNLIPDNTGGSKDLGSASNRWGTVYADVFNGADFNPTVIVTEQLKVTGVSTFEGDVFATGVANTFTKRLDVGMGGTVFTAINQAGIGSVGIGTTQPIGKFQVGIGSTSFNITEEKGRVGIGTTNPRTKLHVYKGASGFDYNTVGDLIVEDKFGAVVHLLSPSAYSGKINFGDENNGMAGRIEYEHSNNKMSFWNQNIQRVTIDGTNVGIGSTTPREKLDVRGKAFITDAGGDILSLESTASSSRTTLKLYTNGNDWEIGARGSATANATNSFYIYDMESSEYRFVINPSGAFGVGGPNNYGTTGQLLQSQGANDTPVWVSPLGLTVENATNVIGGIGDLIQLNVSPGISTLTNLRVSGVSTFVDDIFVGTGATVGFGSTAYFRDQAGIYLGDGEDLKIFHGTSPYNPTTTDQHSYIQDTGTGDLVILSNQVAIRNAAETEDMARFYEGDRVELRFDNTLRFQTTNDGVKIGGGLQDKDGDLGTNGQLLSSTGSELDWVSPAGLTVENANKVGVGSINTGVTNATYNITVTAPVSSYYTLSGSDRNGAVNGNNQPVTLKVGDTINFNLSNVNAIHPFYIRVSSNGANVSTPAATGQGSTGNNTVSWTPNTAGTYVYQCSSHSSMMGTITVQSLIPTHHFTFVDSNNPYNARENEFIYSTELITYDPLNGTVGIGTDTARNVGFSNQRGKLHIEGDSVNTSSFALVNNQNTTQSSMILFGKTRGTSTGSVNTVADGDTLGKIAFCPADGTDLENNTAQIKVVVNGTVSGNQIPTDITFETSPSNSANRTEKLRIGSSGQIGLSGANYGTAGQVLTSQGPNSAPVWDSTSASGLTDILVDYTGRSAPCDMPITISTPSAGTKQINIPPSSNAYGAKYVGPTEPTGNTVCEGDIWYDTSAASGSPTLSNGTTRVAVLQDVRTQGTNGGIALTNNWHGRRLNSKIDPTSLVTLVNGTTGKDGTANTFSLEAGTYFLQWRAPGFDSGDQRAKIAYTTDANYNTLFNSQSSAGVSYLSGESAQSQTNYESNIFASGSATVTITETTYFRLQHYVKSNDAGSTKALGEAGNISGEDEIYSQVVVEDLETAVKLQDTGTTKVAILKDQKNQGVPGGNFTAFGWRDRDLTVEEDPSNFVDFTAGGSQSSGSAGNTPGYWSLAAGTYKIEWSCPGNDVSRHKTRLVYSTTQSHISTAGLDASASFVEGSSENTSSSSTTSEDTPDSSNSVGYTVITLTQTTWFKILHYSTTTDTTYGFGHQVRGGGITTLGPEIYSQVRIEDLATAIKESEVVNTGTTKVALLKDEKNNQINGGTFTASGWRDRDLTVKEDPSNFVTFTATPNGQSTIGSGNTPGYWSLPAGSYKIDWSAPAHEVGRHKTRLVYSTTQSHISTAGLDASASIVEGSASHTATTSSQVTTQSTGSKIITLTQTTWFKVMHYSSATNSGEGFGRRQSSNPGNESVTGTNIYTQVRIEDLATAVKDSSGSGGITVKDEGVALSTLATTLNFVGDGVVASGTGAEKTITISGGGNSFVLLSEKSATGTEVEFTGIPADAKEITVMFRGVSLNANNDILVQLGYSNTWIASGYVSNSENTQGTDHAHSTDGFVIYSHTSNAEHHGSMIINKASSSSYTAIGEFRRSNTGGAHARGSLSSVSGTVERLKVTILNQNNQDAFDAGTISVSYKTGSGSGGTAGTTKVAILRDEKNPNVGSSSGAAYTWIDRDITVKTDPDNFVTLNARVDGQTTVSTAARRSATNGISYFALPAGTYKIKFRAVGYYISQHQAAMVYSSTESTINKVYATTDNVTKIYGTSETSTNNTTTSDSSGAEVVTINQTTYFKVIHYTVSTFSTSDFGQSGSPDKNVYLTIEIEDLATAVKSGVTDKIIEGNTSAEVIDTGSDGKFVVKTEGVERVIVDPSGYLNAKSDIRIRREGGAGGTQNNGGIYFGDSNNNYIFGEDSVETLTFSYPGNGFDFVQDELITSNLSGAFAYVKSWNSSTYVLTIYNRTGSPFQDADIVNGTVSGAAWAIASNGFASSNSDVLTFATAGAEKLRIKGITDTTFANSDDLILMGGGSTATRTNGSPVKGVLNLGTSYYTVDNTENDHRAGSGDWRAVKLHIYKASTGTNANTINNVYGLGLSNGCMEIQTNSDLGFFVGKSNTTADGKRTERMRITNTGNVNVGGNYTQSTFTMLVTGSFAASSKSFVIDHPTKENHTLRHGSLEGPEHAVYVRGKASNIGIGTTNSVINLPDYWVGLVHDDSITVNLTPIGNKRVWVESINNNSVTVGSDDSTEYFYTIFAERKDIDKLTVEVEK